MHGLHGIQYGWARRRDTVSPVGLAAVVAALHLALLTGRVPAFSPARRQGTLMIWRTTADVRAAAGGESEAAASRPVQTYAAGQLSLAAGMAVVTLARWLRIMRLTGTQRQ
jgi:hypothetical protein